MDIKKPDSVIDYEKLQRVFEFIESLNFKSEVKWERTHEGQNVKFELDWDEIDEWEQSN